MEIHERLDDIAQLLETARAVPLSTSCVVPRNEALDLVEDARDALPEAIREADEILANREQLLDDASNEAQQVLSSANAQASDLISGAQHDADRIVDNARADADEMLDRARAEARRMIDEQEVLLRAGKKRPNCSKMPNCGRDRSWTTHSARQMNLPSRLAMKLRPSDFRPTSLSMESLPS